MNQTTENRIDRIHGRNPLMNLDRYFPDGEPHFVDGELYVYPSCDESADYYCSDHYFVPHSGDLKHWTVSGPSFDMTKVDFPFMKFRPAGLEEANCLEELPDYLKKELPAAAKLMPFKLLKKMMMAAVDKYAETQNQCRLLFAPDALTVDGKSYLYFCLSDGSEGVAFSDHPEGPFTDPVQITVDTTGEPISGIDPAIFRDDDGKCYLYWGQIVSYGAELTEDMCHVKAETIHHGLVTEKEHFFHEGSSMRKINGVYYYIYADMERGKPTALGYATSDSPLGPFTYRGIIVDNDGCDPATWNNHGSIECVDGQWMVFYHRSTENSVYKRRMCAEPITIAADGRIAEVIPTSAGIGDKYQPGETVPACEACRVSGGAYIRDDSLILPKGESEAVFRYLDMCSAAGAENGIAAESIAKETPVAYEGTEGLQVTLRVAADGEMTLRIVAGKDGCILKFFEIR